MKPTKKFENFLYWSVAANSMGSWFTLIGLALLVQEKHGGTALAFVWILQSLPMIAFSRKVAERFNVFNLIPLWCSLQIIAAINVFILSFSQSLSSIFIYIFLSTTISCISNSVSRAMISTYVDQEKTPEVFRRSGALSSSLIAVSPIIGAYISNLFGMKYLFIIDAISFIIAAAIIFNFRPSVVNSIPSNSHQKINFNLVGVLAEACRSFADTLTLNSKLKSAPSLMFRQISRHWFYFLIAGAFLNGLEFPLFDHYELSRMQIGYALGAWGVGNFIVLFLPSRIESMLSVSQLTFFFASFSRSFGATGFCASLIPIFNNASFKLPILAPIFN